MKRIDYNCRFFSCILREITTFAKLLFNDRLRNRYRYYSPETGSYLSQDPIGLAGNNPTLYGYVKDTNSWVDFFGLHCSKKLSDNLEANGTKRPANTIAHHIVGSGKRAKPAKDILIKHGIDIDSHKNGVFYLMVQIAKLLAIRIQVVIPMIISTK